MRKASQEGHFRLAFSMVDVNKRNSYYKQARRESCIRHAGSAAW